MVTVLLWLLKGNTVFKICPTICLNLTFSPVYVLRGASVILYIRYPVASLIRNSIRGCIQKFPDWPTGARTASGTALCHQVQLCLYFLSQSSEFCRHNTLCCFLTSVCCIMDSVRELLDTHLYRRNRNALGL
jgi:hypothetical protein